VPNGPAKLVDGKGSIRRDCFRDSVLRLIGGRDLIVDKISWLAPASSPPKTSLKSGFQLPRQISEKPHAIPLVLLLFYLFS
jgi:hypothetical protein